MKKSYFVFRYIIANTKQNSRAKTWKRTFVSEPYNLSLSLWAAASPCGSVVQCALDPDRRMIPGFIAAILLVAAAAGGAAAQSNTTTTPDPHARLSLTLPPAHFLAAAGGSTSEACSAICYWLFSLSLSRTLTSASIFFLSLSLPWSQTRLYWFTLIFKVKFVLLGRLKISFLRCDFHAHCGPSRENNLANFSLKLNKFKFGPIFSLLFAPSLERGSNEAALIFVCLLVPTRSKLWYVRPRL